jgi:hypothetical protein
MNLVLLEKTKKSIMEGPFDMSGWRCCIAAHVIKAHSHNGEFPQVAHDGVGRRAAKFLGLNLEESTKLFYAFAWPDQFFNGLQDEIWIDQENAIRRIDYFIKTLGKDKRTRKLKRAA